MRELAKERRLTLSQLVELVGADRQEGNLSSAIRQFVLGVYRGRVEVQKGVKQLVDLVKSSEINTDVKSLSA